MLDDKANLNGNIDSMYDKDESLYLLKASVLSSVFYSTDYKVSVTFVPKEFECIYKLEGLSYTHNKQNVGYVAKYGKNLIISLVSTSNISDVMFSMNNNLVNIDDGQIHEGYYIHTLEILPNLMKVLSIYPNIKCVYLSGHSMGGVLSSIIGYILNKRYNYKVKVYTYGSPKFGNKQLKYYIENRKNIKIFNVINKADMVPNKPTNKKYEIIGEVISRWIDTGNDNVNHGLKVYREIVLEKTKSDILRREHRFDEILSRWFLDILG
jgi:hypothetical protein